MKKLSQTHRLVKIANKAGYKNIEIIYIPAISYTKMKNGYHMEYSSGNTVFIGHDLSDCKEYFSKNTFKE